MSNSSNNRLKTDLKQIYGTPSYKNANTQLRSLSYTKSCLVLLWIENL